MTSDMMTASEVRSALGLREPKVEHIAVSNKPWGDYTSADYSIEQWHAACLIHQHDGPPTSKAQCKLPVRTPAGTLNANGVHAAAAALAGARGGVNASADQKAAAARALVRFYRQLNDDPPPSLMQSAINKVEGFIAHFGVRGMKWGVRNSSSGGSGSAGGGKSSSALHNEAKKSAGRTGIKRLLGDKTYWKRAAVIGGVGVTGLAAASLAVSMPALIPAGVLAYAGGSHALGTMIAGGSLQGMRVANAVNYINYLHRSSPSRVQHADEDGGPTVEDVYNAMSAVQKDAAAVIVASAIDGSDLSDDAELSSVWDSMDSNQQRVTLFFASASMVDSMAQSDLTDKFLAHFGIRGMKWGVRRDRGPGGTVSSALTKSRENEPDDIVAIKTKAATSGVHSLSNNEMQTLVNRMKLQTQIDDINRSPAKTEKGRAFVDRQLKTAETINKAITFYNSPAGRLMTSVISPKSPGAHTLGKSRQGTHLRLKQG